MNLPPPGSKRKILTFRGKIFTLNLLLVKSDFWNSFFEANDRS